MKNKQLHMANNNTQNREKNVRREQIAVTVFINH